MWRAVIPTCLMIIMLRIGCLPGVLSQGDATLQVKYSFKGYSILRSYRLNIQVIITSEKYLVERTETFLYMICNCVMQFRL